jgi:putative lipoprotein
MNRYRTACAAACAVVAAASLTAQGARVSGTVTYRERVALTPRAAVEITLEDVSRADAAANVIARLRLESPGQPPIAFELPYDASRIDPRRRYAVRAQIFEALCSTPSAERAAPTRRLP